MLYREAGQFKSTYAADTAIFPIRQDRIGMALILLAAFVAVPLLASPYLFSAILIPFLILSLAAIGLNILTGYAGQLSLGSAAFMAVGAFAAYNFVLRIPGIPLRHIWVIVWAVAGLVALAAGIIWGSKLGVQFSIALVALKALPVLMLGGLTSVPGAIVGGLLVGAGEKLSEVFLGPYFGGGIENWFAYVLALLVLLARPQGLFGERIIERV